MPAEDTYLLLDAINIAILGRSKNKNLLIMDMGCGCGIIGLCASKYVKHADLVDINPYAVANARLNKSINNIKNARTVEGDLFDAHRGTGKRYDIIFFNPPYLPAENSLRACRYVKCAFEGGKKGNEVILRFINSVGRHIKDKGSCFIVLSSLNNIEEVRETAETMGFSFSEIKKVSFFFETLYLIEMKHIRI